MPGSTFYLVGSLPALIVYGSGKKELANLKVREKIDADDPKIRDMVGVKASTRAHREKYRVQIDKMVAVLEKSVTRALKTYKWKDKPINQLILVNI